LPRGEVSCRKGQITASRGGPLILHYQPVQLKFQAMQ
jgi:hypothetical protein